MINYRPPRGMVVPIQVSDVHALLPPLHGTGFLSGTVTDDGAPVVATIRALWRPPNADTLESVIAGETQSSSNGAWKIENLNSDLEYVVVAALSDRNDVIAIGFSPIDPPRFSESTVAATVGVPFDYILPVIGGRGMVTATLATGSLPSGISYANGHLIGTWPTGSTGNYPLTFDLTDDNETVQAELTINLILLPITLTAMDPLPTTLEAGVAMTPVRFRAAGGEGPYTIQVDTGALPTGTSVTTIDTETVEWGGTPSAGSYSFTLKATGVRGTPATKSYSVSVRSNLAWNPADKSAHIILSNTDRTAAVDVGQWYGARASVGRSSGKYCFRVQQGASAGVASQAAGIALLTASLDNWLGSDENGWGHLSDGYKTHAGYSSYGSRWDSPSDELMVLVDLDAGKLWFGVNGVYMGGGDPVAGTNPAFSGIPAGTYFPMCSTKSTVDRLTIIPESSLPAGFLQW